MEIKVILIEDDPGVRLLLRKMIEKQGGFEIAGECDNLTDAIALFHRVKPQVIFLDVEIKGASGVDCAKIIAELEPKTKIIFATAHDEYMSEAFEVYAFDYLVKPFDLERVQRTLDRIQNGLKTEAVYQEVQKEKLYDRLLIKGKDSACFVETKDIVLIQREEGNTVIYTTEEYFVTSQGLTELESRLDPALFMRSHKSYIINVSKIRRIEPYGRWTYIVLFKNLERDALITARKYDELKQRYI